jgi:hypothetical protein
MKNNGDFQQNVKIDIVDTSKTCPWPNFENVSNQAWLFPVNHTKTAPL